jgi:hypothetical protein
MWQKSKKLLLPVIIASSTVLAYLSLNDGHDWGDDFAAYLHQAQSLVEGRVDDYLQHGYFTKEHSCGKWPVATTWGFPILLTPIYYFFGMDLFKMKLLLLFFKILSLILIYLLFKNRLDSLTNILIVSLFAFNPYLMRFNNQILTDIPFLFFTLFSLYLIDKFVIQQKQFINRYVSAGLLGFVIFYAYFIRSNGILLGPILLISQIVIMLQSRLSFKRLFSFLLPYFLFLVLLGVAYHIFPFATGDYVFAVDFSITQMIQNIKQNIPYYLGLPSKFWGSSVIYGMTLPFFVIGFISSFHKDYHFVLYCGLTIGLYLVLINALQGLRYILPIIPFYVYFVFKGLSCVKVRLDVSTINLSRNGLCQICASLLLAFFVIQSIHGAYNNIKKSDQPRNVASPFDATSREMFKFISENTNKDSVIIFFKPRAMRLITDRRSIRACNLAEILRGDYFVLYKNFGFLPKNTRNNLPPSLEIIFENRFFKIFKVTDKFRKTVSTYTHNYSRFQ